MSKTYTALRTQFNVFRYESYSIECDADDIVLRWRFSIPGLADFSPTTRIPAENLQLANAPDSSLAQKMAFALGLAEAVSYWKCACSPTVEILCGTLSEWDAEWWKNLWFQGLGEFFYRNNIQPDFADFVTFRSIQSASDSYGPEYGIKNAGLRLVPIGGGKDSCVSLHLLRGEKVHNRLFTINDQPARTDCALAAGYSKSNIVRTYRTIDPELLRLNREGYLNGHTPFSAVTAFLSAYCAVLIGADEIALSNESSANEPSVAGTDINHQYSKSYAFERDFREYGARHFGSAVHCYSLLRPFNELQIAAQFSALSEFHPVFRSCNAGSKTNIWCGKCGKCLFTFGLMSAFLPPEKVTAILGQNLFENTGLLPDLEGLLGITPVKPFECVGTIGEFRAALTLAVTQYGNGTLPPLLSEFVSRMGASKPTSYLLERNNQHFVPQDRMPAVEEMYNHAAKFIK
ncbi:MAG: hypothetical protein LBJ12_00420 [Oscillospiraceae bacterium]|jgi:hypothetical protein|nr:hypothetical protein [Oscillospiraceae bacterium]